MAYSKGGYPIEQASKIGHLKMLKDPTIRQIVESFEAADLVPLRKLNGHIQSISLSEETSIKRVIAIDGGQAIVLLARSAPPYISA